ncbi:MAG: hypothetical protein AB1806_05060 [Acidobacteriota bacterium]
MAKMDRRRTTSTFGIGPATRVGAPVKVQRTTTSDDLDTLTEEHDEDVTIAFCAGCCRAMGIEPVQPGGVCVRCGGVMCNECARQRCAICDACLCNSRACAYLFGNRKTCASHGFWERLQHALLKPDRHG